MFERPFLNHVQIPSLHAPGLDLPHALYYCLWNQMGLICCEIRRLCPFNKGRGSGCFGLQMATGFCLPNKIFFKSILRVRKGRLLTSRPMWNPALEVEPSLIIGVISGIQSFGRFNAWSIHLIWKIIDVNKTKMKKPMWSHFCPSRWV